MGGCQSLTNRLQQIKDVKQEVRVYSLAQKNDKLLISMKLDAFFIHSPGKVYNF